MFGLLQLIGMTLVPTAGVIPGNPDFWISGLTWDHSESGGTMEIQLHEGASLQVNQSVWDIEEPPLFLLRTSSLLKLSGTTDLPTTAIKLEDTGTGHLVTISVGPSALLYTEGSCDDLEFMELITAERGAVDIDAECSVHTIRMRGGQFVSIPLSTLRSRSCEIHSSLVYR